MNKYLEKDIKLKIGCMDRDLNEEDLEKINELGINNFTFSNKPKEIDLTELEKFPNLKFVTLQHFDINKKIFETFIKLKELQYIQIASCKCDFEDMIQIPTLESFIINCCKFENLEGLIATKNLTINNINEVIDIKPIQNKGNIENFKLSNIKKVRNFNTIEQMENLKYLNIDGTKVDNKEILEKIKNKVQISQKTESFHIK